MWLVLIFNGMGTKKKTVRPKLLDKDPICALQCQNLLSAQTSLSPVLSEDSFPQPASSSTSADRSPGRCESGTNFPDLERAPVLVENGEHFAPLNPACAPVHGISAQENAPAVRNLGIFPDLLSPPNNVSVSRHLEDFVAPLVGPTKDGHVSRPPSPVQLPVSLVAEPNGLEMSEISADPSLLLPRGVSTHPTQPAAGASGAGLQPSTAPEAARLHPHPQRKSFADLFNQNGPASTKCDFYPQNGSSVTIPASNIKKVDEIWGFCLLARFVGINVDRQVMFEAKKAIKVQFQYILHPSGWVIFRFNSEADKLTALGGGPYSVRNKALVLTVIPDFFSFGISECTKFPVWVRLINLPLELWCTDSISRLGSFIGRPLQIDYFTAKKLKVGYARVLVEVDISKDLPSSFSVNCPGHNYEQAVEYEDLPDFCRSCNSVGHSNENCKEKAVMDRPTIVNHVSASKPRMESGKRNDNSAAKWEPKGRSEPASLRRDHNPGAETNPPSMGAAIGTHNGLDPTPSIITNPPQEALHEPRSPVGSGEDLNITNFSVSEAPPSLNCIPPDPGQENKGPLQGDPASEILPVCPEVEEPWQTSVSNLSKKKKVGLQKKQSKQKVILSRKAGSAATKFL